MWIEVKYLRDIPKLQAIKEGDWIDLYTGEDVVIVHNEFCLIPLGVAISLPYGYEAIIAPRSSTFLKYSLIQTNGIGIIDNSYRGDNDEWHFPAYNLGCTKKIDKGTRLCQFRIFKNQPNFDIKTVGTLGNR